MSGLSSPTREFPSNLPSIKTFPIGQLFPDVDLNFLVKLGSDRYLGVEFRSANFAFIVYNFVHKRSAHKRLCDECSTDSADGAKRNSSR